MSAVVNHWIDGKEYVSRSNRTAPVFDPALGVESKRVALANQEEINLAISTARKAFPTWRDTSLAKRQSIIFNFRELLNKKKSELNKPESSLAETELEEMASYKFFRVADRAKFDALKDIYAGTVEEKILDAIADAGEQGITQANLASELQMASALINPILKKFGSINAMPLIK